MTNRKYPGQSYSLQNQIKYFSLVDYSMACTDLLTHLSSVHLLYSYPHTWELCLLCYGMYCSTERNSEITAYAVHFGPVSSINRENATVVGSGSARAMYTISGLSSFPIIPLKWQQSIVMVNLGHSVRLLWVHCKDISEYMHAIIYFIILYSLYLAMNGPG